MKPRYTVVIACAEASPTLPSLLSLTRLPVDERPVQVILAEGRNPSRQRNLGVETAKAPLVYFLDDDSDVPPGTPKHLASHFEDERTAASGGPNLASPDATPFERTVSAVLASYLGSFSVRTRYSSRGSVKEATEKDLILCNMMVSRKTFLAEKGFREDLFPNEENEFLNRLLHQGRQLMYDPRAHIYRPRRKDWAAWSYQAFRYGRGRARQMKIYPCLSDLIHLAPGFFLLYLLSLPVLAHRLVQQSAHPLLHVALLIPLLTFVLLDLATGLSAASWHRRLNDLWKVPALILARHLAYGLGLWVGFFTPLPPDHSGPVKLYEAQLNPRGAVLRAMKLPVGRRP